MFKFAHPEFLYALAVLPVLLVLFLYAVKRKKKSLSRFGEYAIIRHLMPDVSNKKYALRFWILFFALGLLIVMIARPQMGSKLENVTKRGIEVMICLDVSNSMMSKDVTPSRLERAKIIMSRLIDNLENDKVGLVVFAGDAFVQLPITTDFISAKMFLNNINTSMVPVQGTQIGKAVSLATRSFTSNPDIAKTIILITDGEGHEDNATAAVEAAVNEGITVNVIGIGSSKGGTIPIEGRNNYLKDNQGNVVVTKLNETMCREIAVAGKGIYVLADNTNNTVRTLQQELDKMTKVEMETKVYASYSEGYRIFAWAVLILLVFEAFLLNRKNKFLSKFKLFS
ncbi:VWA domain-containing protein [Bacteroidales bacterium OttesenSCG-928-J19]|nr:VWA domain-containing protein [Bacteroidales bacterium OttesenSCG-928-J19]